jgi:hypothetical protein
MASTRHNSIVIEYVVLVLAHIEQSIDDSNSREQWRTSAHGVLHYWLEKLVAESAGRSVALEAALEAAKVRALELRQQNAKLALRVKELENVLRTRR